MLTNSRRRDTSTRRMIDRLPSLSPVGPNTPTRFSFLFFSDTSSYSPTPYLLSRPDVLSRKRAHTERLGKYLSIHAAANGGQGQLFHDDRHLPGAT